MTDEKETGGQIPRIENKEQLTQWLNEKKPPLEFCVALAARATLRALPFIICEDGAAGADRLEAFASLVFRATAVSLVVARHRNSIRARQIDLDAAFKSILPETDNSDQSISALARSGFNVTKAAKYLLASNLSRDNTSDNNLLTVDISPLDIPEPSEFDIVMDMCRAIEYAVSSIPSLDQRKFLRATENRSAWGKAWGGSWGNSWGGVTKFRDAQGATSSDRIKKVIWKAVELDIQGIGSGRNSGVLASKPLWHLFPPPSGIESWRSLLSLLPDHDAWWVWKDWYEDQVNANPHNEAHELIFVTVPKEEWEKGPAIGNAWIAAKLAEIDKSDEAEDTFLSTPPDDFSAMTFGEAVEAIKDWFFENYEDPAHHTPYESREGGYQYIWGGPYNARDVIENIFADKTSQEVMNEAINEIEAEGFGWVPNFRRNKTFDEENLLSPDPSVLHTEMLERIEALEKAIEEARRPHQGMGHNNPPEDIEIDGLNSKDFQDIQEATQVLKSQPVEPTDGGAAAKIVLEKLREKLAKLGEYVWNETKKKAVSSILGFSAKWLYDNLEDLISIASRWLEIFSL